MAKLDRKDVKIFAENSKETLITEFRTEDSEGNTASFSRDPDVIQNENYSQGWVNDTNNLNTKIYGEDLNAVNYVLSYLLKYLYENGIAEWKSTTTYYKNSICKVDNALYLSLQNNNIGNDPTSTVSYWKLIPLENVSIEDSGSGFSIVKDVTDNVITFKTISVTGYGEITDNGDQLNIDIAGGGGGGGGDTYWGTIRGTITNQTDLISLINLKQDILTVDSPLVLTDEQHLTINKATSSVSGYLDYNDFNTFNGKQDTISATLPISITNNNIEIATANTSTTGALSYTDWNTFNNKQNAINGLTITETSTTFDVVPKSTITTSNIGSSSKWFSNSYVENNRVKTIIGQNYVDGITYPSSNSEGHTVIYDAGTTSQTSGRHEFRSGGDTILTINEDGEIVATGEIVAIGDIVPVSDNGVWLGRTGEAFAEGYINDIHTQNILPTTGNTSINIGGDLIPSSNDTYTLGMDVNTRFKQLWVNEIHMRGGLTPIVAPNNVYIGTTNNKVGDIYCTRINGSNYNPSDRDKKENIVKRTNETKGKKSSLEIINSLETYTYNYKDDENKTIHIGIMAQDLASEISECVVDKGEENTKGEHKTDLYIDVMGYVTVLTEAVKQLSAKVQTLEARIEELEGNKEGELKK